MARRQSLNSLKRKALRFEGLEEVTENLGRVIDSVVGAEAKRVYVEAAAIGRDTVREMAPQGKTGNLKKGVFAAAGDENQPNALLGMNYKIAPHAHLVEYGHGGGSPAPPHPYFRPGIIAAGSRMGARIREGLARVLENAAARKA